MPQPRPADFAIAGNRMLIELLQMIWRRRYRKHHPDNMGKALEVMLVSMWLSIATRDGAPPTVSEVSKCLFIPPSTAGDHLARLEQTERVTRIKRRYHADLDYLDSLFSLSYVDHAIAVIETCLTRLKALRAELQHQLKP